MNRKELWERLYMRSCRSYARLLSNRPADSIFRLLFSIEFLKEHHYWPHLKKPRTFSERICNRMLFDRDPIWTMLSDKLRVREYVASKAGSQYTIPLLWHGPNPEDIPFDQLPSKFVIKTNHGAGYNIIVKNKDQLDRDKAKASLKQWLKESFCYDKLCGAAWAYKNIRPKVLVETFLDDNGDVPADYKFFCFSGRVEFVQVSFDRFGDASERILDRNFVPLGVYNRLKLYQGVITPPDNYENMVYVAERLSSHLNFIRVDMYSVGNEIYVGELTCYPAAGLARFEPRSYDFVFGQKWTNTI